MNKFKKTIAGLTAVAFVLSLVVVSTTSSKAAMTTAELEAQIQTLMAQLSAVSAPSSAPAASYNFTRSLTLGASGSDVTALQNFLIGKGYQIPAGATGFFGGQTQAAVSAFQKAKAITPSTGYFGPVTQAAVASMMANDNTTGGTPANPGTTPTPPVTTSTSTNPSTSNDGPLEGDAGDINDVDVLSSYSNEEVNEGDEDVKVLAFEVEADEGSDLEIKNVRLAFEHTGSGSKRMNKYIEAVKVWAGSKEAGSADEDEFSENSDVYSKSIVLDGAVVRAGEKVKFYVSVDATSNVDSGDLDQEWNVTLESIRFEDASGVVTTEDEVGDLGDGGTVDNRDFVFQDLTSSGDLEVKISEGSSNPDAKVVEVDDTSDTNDVVLLEVKIKAEGSDVTIDELQFDVTSVGSNIAYIAKEFKLLVDGDEIDSVSAPSATGTSQVTFDDLEDDFMIGKDKTVTVRLVADINDIEGTFGNGDSLVASLTSTNFSEANATIDDENGDTVDDADRTGSVTGEVQTFYSDGISVDVKGTPTGTVTSKSGAADVLTYEVVMNITAFGSDIFVSNATTTDYDFTFSGTTPTVTSDQLKGKGTENGDDSSINKDYFKIEEGDTREFTYTIVLSAASTTPTSVFNFEVTDIGFGTTPLVIQSYGGDLDDTEVSTTKTISISN